MVGAFAALAIGATLVIGAVQVIVALGDAAQVQPERYRAAPIVVAGQPAMHIVTGRGDEREVESDPNTAKAALSPELVSRLAAAPGVQRVVLDRSFPVRLAQQATVGHPWSAGALTPYRLVAGRAPSAAGEVVATVGGLASKVGATVAVVTPAGPMQVRVVGIAEPAWRGPIFERPLFFEDAQAAALAPAIDAVGVTPASALPAVESLLADRVVALTGDRRGAAEENPDRLVADGAVSLMGITVGTVVFVAIFVIASAFAFSVALRRRELGLLRAVGATPRQVRRMVLWEAAILAALGALAGAVGSLLFTPALVHWMVDRGLAPATLSTSGSPIAVISGAGAMLVVAVIGAWLGARRASRVRPAEALRDAVVDRGVMTKSRWVIAVLTIGGAVALMSLAGVSSDIDAQIPIAFGQAVLLIIGLTMLAPVVVPRLVGLVALPGLAGRGPVAMLVREHARTAVRRTAATATPVLVAIGLTASLTTMVDTIDASARASDRARLLPGVLAVTADGGLSASDVAALQSVPGATVGATLDGDVRTFGSEGLSDYPAAGVDQTAPELMLRVPAIHGSLHDLRGDSVALGEVAARTLHRQVGQRLRVWLPDGLPRTLTVVAVLADGLGSTAMYVPREVLLSHAGPAAATTVYLRLPPGESAGELRRIAAERALQVEGGGSEREVPVDDNSRMNRLGLELILGIAVLYVIVSLAGTAGVATVARRGELAGLRLAGATRRQVVRFVLAEALATTAVGAMLGFAVTVVLTVGLHRSLGSLRGPTEISVPWPLLVALFAVCAAIAAGAVAATAALTQRRAPIYK